MAISERPKKRRESIRRPFSKPILQRARDIADTYQIVIWNEDGDVFGRGVELPGTMNDGTTPDECVKNTRESLVTTIAYMLERNETPPPPAMSNLRTEQVNVRLSATERFAIETASKQNGFTGLSDYMRAAAIEGTRRPFDSNMTNK